MKFAQISKSHWMVVFAQAFPEYEVDRICNQVNEDLKNLDRKQSSNVSI